MTSTPKVIAKESVMFIKTGLYLVAVYTPHWGIHNYIVLKNAQNKWELWEVRDYSDNYDMYELLPGVWAVWNNTYLTKKACINRTKTMIQ